jgi:uncharacterized protein
MAEPSLIDFHVHFFPDSIVEKAISSLSENSGVKPHGDGSIASLRKFMEEDGVALSVNMPVATKADQVKNINRQMIELNKDGNRVVCFGAMHPDFNRIGSVPEELDFIAACGVKGIKLHPEYQDFYPDDPRMQEIYDACRKNGLIIMFHAGRDLAFKDVHGTPKRFAEVAKIKKLKIICAHMGGYQMWDDVETYLVGLEGVYFDTSFSLEMDNAQMKEIIVGHGPYKILFGTDFPWQRAGDIVQKIKSLDIGANMEGMIFNRNAHWLLDS